MRVKGSYAPEPMEFEAYGNMALIRFYENVEPYEEQGDNTTPPDSGYAFDRYTIERPNEDGLEERIRAEMAVWLGFAKHEEITMLSETARSKRNTLLAEIDWIQALDAPISTASREALRLYRQELRDISERPEFPYIERWPECPAIEKGLPDPADAALRVLIEGVTENA